MSFRLFLVVENLHDAMDLVFDRFWSRDMEDMGDMEVHGD
jgi:hypothetical protein